MNVQMIKKSFVKLLKYTLIITMFMAYSCQMQIEEDILEIQNIHERIVIDGKLDENSWNLNRFDFKTKEGDVASDFPHFQILKDDSLIYFGTSYNLTELNHNDQNNIKKIIVRYSIKSLDTIGNGYKFDFIKHMNTHDNLEVDLYACKKLCKMLNTIKYTQIVKNNVWTIEFSIPKSDLLHPDYNLIDLDISFYKIRNDNTIIRCYYPEDDKSVKIRIRD